MKKNFKRVILIALVLMFGSMNVFGQQFRSWWFFAPKSLAERKVIPMQELSACLLGEDSTPKIRSYFKKVVDGGPQTQAGLLYKKMCDVALIYNILPAEDKRLGDDYPGYAIYKISGSTLELYLYPKEVKYVAVAHMKFAGAQSLLKKDLAARGTPALQWLFAPLNRIWREGWSTWQAPIKDLKAENNPIAYDGTDIWIMSEDDYKTYVKRVGAKHPVFEIQPDKDELTRRK